MRITFHGAARQVTGSAHLLEIGPQPHRILLDCGLYDSDRISLDSPNRHLTFDPLSLDAVVVSHAHNDHIGRLPCLTRAGYRGPIYMTPATADIANLMLRDSARIQREDAQRYAERMVRQELAETGVSTAVALKHHPAVPLFELEDVERVIDLIQRVPYGTEVDLTPDVRLTYHDAGHILGSAIVELLATEHGQRRRVVFTGDLGRRGMGLLPDPQTLQEIDVLISESTYGNKELDPYHKLIKQLHAIVARATRLGSKIVIPAFSLGRTQRMVYCLQELFRLHHVKPIPVFVDSPLATRLTEIHREHPSAYRPQALKVMEDDLELFGHEAVSYCLGWEESRRIASLAGPMVIISSSGMCEAGRVRAHLRNTVQNPNNAVVIVSYQAEGTLGRQIAEGAEQIQIQDQWYELNAAVYVLDGFSGHADRNDLIWWFQETGGGIGRAFLVHGEPEAMLALAPEVQAYVKTDVVLPETLGTYEV